MREHFLAFVWQHKLYNPYDLCTTDGQHLEVIHPGFLNEDAGPDFKEAQLMINGILWRGHVELHVKASEWYTHNHHHDPAYDAVVLHVVHQSDKIVHRTNGSVIPCLPLNGRIKKAYFDRYEKLKANLQWLPCNARIKDVRSIILTNTIHRMAVERLESKTEELKHRLSQIQGNWSQLVFERLASGMGFKINSFAFEQIARNTPLKVIMKSSDDLTTLEALFFGQAHMLSDIRDDYQQKLSEIYAFLKRKHQLQPIQVGQLKFLRTRPSNFPTVRLAQLAALFYRQSHLCQQLLEVQTNEEWESLMQVNTSTYWQDHYNFNKPSSKSFSRDLSQSSLDLLLINTLVPLQFAYGQFLGSIPRREASMRLLDNLKAENNKVTRRWNDHGVSARSAMETQGLLHMHRHYCNLQQCLKCPIGKEIICRL